MPQKTPPESTSQTTNQWVPRRLIALIRKEFNQIRRDRRLAVSLVVPPTLQLLLFGFALNSTVSDLRLGVIDDSHSPESRELVAVMGNSGSFRTAGVYLSEAELTSELSRGSIDAGLHIPYDFTRYLQRGRPATVQILLNAVNANTATIAEAYALGVIQDYNRTRIRDGGVHAQMRQVMASQVTQRGTIRITPAYLFNPGLVSSWFVVTGTFGVLLILNSSLIASAAMIKEREAGTVEQLLMTPATTAEIILAKILPIFCLLLIVVAIAVGMLRFVFHVPFRGSLPLVLIGAALCVLCGIGIGTLVASFSKSAQQAQLMSFFVNPPLASLSGSLTPREAMPHWLQPVTVVNPIYHFGVIARAALLKGTGIEALWPNLLALTLIALLCLGVSVQRFRKQLG